MARVSSRDTSPVRNSPSPPPPAGLGIEIEFTPGASKLIIPVDVCGHPADLLIDTGAGPVALTRRFLDRTGISREGEATTVSHAQGTSDATLFKLDRVDLSGMEARGVDGVQIESADRNGQLDGLLGMDYLKHFRVDHDGPSGSFKLLQRGNLPPVETRPSSFCVNFAPGTKLLALPLTIGGQTGRFLLDTGADAMVLSTDFARRAGLLPPVDQFEANMQGAFGARQGVARVDPDITLGHLTLEQIPTAVTQAPPPAGLDGMIGMSFLCNFRMQLDVGDGRLVLTPHGA
jgi:clan AA aspartic protease (TIGR02281 family)